MYLYRQKNLPLLEPSRRHSLLLVHFRRISCRFERVAGLWQRHEVFAVVFVRLSLVSWHPYSIPSSTYKRNTTVSARSNLRLIRVDKDLGMTQWTTATITAGNPFLRPTNMLLMDQFNSSHRLRLSSKISSHP